MSLQCIKLAKFVLFMKITIKKQEKHKKSTSNVKENDTKLQHGESE